MKSGTIFAKTLWVISRLGPMELLKRARRYFKNYKINWLWVYRNKESAYKAWLKKESRKIEKKLATAQYDIQKFSCKPLISILMPISGTQISHLEESIESVINQAYPLWELVIMSGAPHKNEVEGILGKYTKKDCRIIILDHNNYRDCAFNEAVTSIKGDFLGFMDCGDVLAPHALLEVVRLSNEKPEAEVIYSDEDHIKGKAVRFNPLFKPGWSPDLMLSTNYINHFLVAGRRLLQGIDLDGLATSSYYDLVLRLTEHTNEISHIPEILYHSRAFQFTPADLQYTEEKESDQLKALEDSLKRRGLDGDVLQAGQGRYRVKLRVQGEPLVSIIIPVRDKIDLLKNCINSIKEKSTYHNYEIIVVDNGSVENESSAYFKELQSLKGCSVLLFDEPFNYSKINNYASRQARGEHLLFLNNDIEVISPGWLEEMISHCQRPGTGAVGVKLLFPDNRIQHAGVVVGLRRVAMHAFHGISNEEGGYMDLTEVLRNSSAVTAACMMIPKHIFDEVGGFDEELAVAYNDVDLCLRVIDKGYFIVWTPHALLYHYESASRGQYYPEQDLHYFCKKWERVLELGDPFYNPNLSLNHSDFRVRI